MATNLELSQSRLEVKNEITTGINKTPMALLFNVTGKLLQKITRYPKPLPLMFSVVILALTILLVLGLDFIVLFRETETVTQISFGSAITVIGVMFLCVVLTYFNIKRVLVSLRDTIVDFIVSPEDLSDLRQWLSFGWSSSTIRFYAFLWTIFCVGWALLIFSVLGKGFSAIGLLIPAVVYGFLGGVAWYYVPLMLLLPLRLKSYQFRLYESDPARSEVIERLSTILSRFTYGYVFMIILLQLSLTTFSFPIIGQIVFIAAFGWIPVIIQYLANQTGIRSIISRAKRKTLNRIQAEIQTLHDVDIKNKENIETINRLMDYHERIRVTPNTNLNIQSFGNFLNQLALPLLGFVLANIGTILDFFR